MLTGNLSQTRRSFTGQYLDDTGLLFYNARYYDPGIGRFVSADSIVPSAGSLTVTPSDAVASKAWSAAGAAANPQELNRYSYVNNNPVGAGDPTGHCPMCVGALIGAGIDFAVQMATTAGGDYRNVNYVQVGVSAAVGATGVGLGGVIANSTKSVAVNIVRNTVASALVSAVGAEVQNKAQDALTPGRFARVDPVRAAAVGALTGGTGAMIAETARMGTKALANYRYSRLPLDKKLIINSSAIIPDKVGKNIYEHMYGAGNFASITFSNAGPALPSNITNRLPSSGTP